MLKPLLHSPSARWLATAPLAAALLLAWQASAAQNRPGIYTCIDSKGRRLTSDRPIPECLDREQKELSGSGTVKRVVPPSYTAEERARLEAEKRKEAEALARAAEEKRRDKALLIRYPNKGVHDKERAEALLQIDEVIGAVHKREEALASQRKELDVELEFYKGDLSLAPGWLKRKYEDNEQQLKIQQRFLADQAQEKQRINARFDEELVKLRQLWAGK